MKILIYGAGIVGTTYGWQLSKAGHEIAVLVRPEKKQAIKEEGIHIHCADFRGGKKEIEDIVFKPDVIDSLSADNNFEYHYCINKQSSFERNTTCSFQVSRKRSYSFLSKHVD